MFFESVPYLDYVILLPNDIFDTAGAASPAWLEHDAKCLRESVGTPALLQKYVFLLALCWQKIYINA